MSKMGRYILDQEEKGNIVMTEEGYQPTSKYLSGDRTDPLIEELVKPLVSAVSEMSERELRTKLKGFKIV